MYKRINAMYIYGRMNVGRPKERIDLQRLCKRTNDWRCKEVMEGPVEDEKLHDGEPETRRTKKRQRETS